MLLKINSNYYISNLNTKIHEVGRSIIVARYLNTCGLIFSSHKEFVCFGFCLLVFGILDYKYLFVLEKVKFKFLKDTFKLKKKKKDSNVMALLH